VELPRGLFTEAIKNKLREIDNPEINEALSREVCNVNFMIGTYFKEIRKDGPQKFYSPISDITKKLKQLKDNVKSAEGEKGDPQKEEIKKLRNQKNVLCQYPVEDMLMLMMAEKIMQLPEFTNMKLSSIVSPNNSTILDTPCHLTIKVKIPPTQSLPEGKTVEVSKDNFKIKDYGRFFNILHDKRVKTLFGNIKETKVASDDVNGELDAFDSTCPKIFKQTDAFESARMQGLSEEEIKRKYKKESPQFTDIVEVELSSMPKDKRKQLEMIRNAFGHSTYPEIDIYEENTLPDIANYMGERFTNLLNSQDTEEAKSDF